MPAGSSLSRATPRVAVLMLWWLLSLQTWSTGASCPCLAGQPPAARGRGAGGHSAVPLRQKKPPLLVEEEEEGPTPLWYHLVPSFIIPCQGASLVLQQGKTELNIHLLLLVPADSPNRLLSFFSSALFMYLEPWLLLKSFWCLTDHSQCDGDTWSHSSAALLSNFFNPSSNCVDDRSCLEVKLSLEPSPAL